MFEKIYQLPLFFILCFFNGLRRRYLGKIIAKNGLMTKLCTILLLQDIRSDEYYGEPFAIDADHPIGITEETVFNLLDEEYSRHMIHAALDYIRFDMPHLDLQYSEKSHEYWFHYVVKYHPLFQQKVALEKWCAENDIPSAALVYATPEVIQLVDSALFEGEVLDTIISCNAVLGVFKIEPRQAILHRAAFLLKEEMRLRKQ